MAPPSLPPSATRRSEQAQTRASTIKPWARPLGNLPMAKGVKSPREHEGFAMGNHDRIIGNPKSSMQVGARWPTMPLLWH